MGPWESTGIHEHPARRCRKNLPHPQRQEVPWQQYRTAVVTHTQPFRDHTIGVRHGPVDKLMVPGAVCQLDGGAFWGAKGTFLSTGICRLEGAYSVNWAWAASAALGRSSAQGRASRSSLGSVPSLISFWPLHGLRVSESLYAAEPL